MRERNATHLQRRERYGRGVLSLGKLTIAMGVRLFKYLQGRRRSGMHVPRHVPSGTMAHTLLEAWMPSWIRSVPSLQYISTDLIKTSEGECPHYGYTPPVRGPIRLMSY